MSEKVLKSILSEDVEFIGSVRNNIVIKPNVKLECVSQVFAIWANTLGAGRGVEETARARVCLG